MLYFFGVADLKSAEEVILSVADQGPKSSDLDTTSPSAQLGLGWYAKQGFLLKACDFMLGSKSPLCSAGEKRPDMGNYASSPDFTHLVNLVTVLIDDKEV